jgi:hypothetical protein
MHSFSVDVKFRKVIRGRGFCRIATARTKLQKDVIHSKFAQLRVKLARASELREYELLEIFWVSPRVIKVN